MFSVRLLLVYDCPVIAYPIWDSSRFELVEEAPVYLQPKTMKATYDTALFKDVDGMTYRIISNTSVTGVGEITVVLDPNTPLVEEHAAGDIATLIPNAYSNLIIAPSSTGLTGAIVGVASTFIPNDATNIQYTWIQTSGDTTVKGEMVTFVVGQGAYLLNNVAASPTAASNGLVNPMEFLIHAPQIIGCNDAIVVLFFLQETDIAENSTQGIADFVSNSGRKLPHEG